MTNSVFIHYENRKDRDRPRKNQMSPCESQNQSGKKNELFTSRLLEKKNGLAIAEI